MYSVTFGALTAFFASTLFLPVYYPCLALKPEKTGLAILLSSLAIVALVFGAAWRYDSLGPRFCVNFVWGQRFLQVSAALPEERCPGRAKGIPIDFTEQVRQDEDIPWIQVEAFGAGKYHQFDVKVMPAVRWEGTGERNVQVVIIRPLTYRPRKGAKL